MEYYFNSEFLKHPRTGEPRSLRDQVDRVMYTLLNSPEPGGVPDDGISASRPPVPPRPPAPVPVPFPKPRHWTEVAENIVHRMQQEQEQAQASPPPAAVPRAPAPTNAASAPSYAERIYDQVRADAYLQANKIADDLARYYREVINGPLGFLRSAGASFGPFGAEAGQAAGAASRALGYLSTAASHALAQRALQKMVGRPVYRVWGDDAPAFGKSWTSVHPESVANYRSSAGLPPENAGRFVSEGVLNSVMGVHARRARPVVPGQRADLPELVIQTPQENVMLRRVAGANPEY